jgi:hypothetical protein
MAFLRITQPPFLKEKFPFILSVNSSGSWNQQKVLGDEGRERGNVKGGTVPHFSTKQRAITGADGGVFVVCVAE